MKTKICTRFYLPLLSLLMAISGCQLDADEDGIPNRLDKFPNNIAASVDTDDDGYPDEFNADCNAACQAESGLVLDTDNDNDGWLNRVEVECQTDPQDADVGLYDGDELQCESALLSQDTDGDHFSDLEELAAGTSLDDKANSPISWSFLSRDPDLRFKLNNGRREFAVRQTFQYQGESISPLELSKVFEEATTPEALESLSLSFTLIRLDEKGELLPATATNVEFISIDDLNGDVFTFFLFAGLYYSVSNFENIILTDNGGFVFSKILATCKEKQVGEGEPSSEISVNPNQCDESTPEESQVTDLDTAVVWVDSQGVEQTFIYDFGDNELGGELVSRQDGTLVLSQSIQGGQHFLVEVSPTGAFDLLLELDTSELAPTHSYSLISTLDDGFLVYGTRGEGVDYWAQKFDGGLNLEWENTFTGAEAPERSFHYDYMRSAIATLDGGYLLAGNSLSGAGADKSSDSRGDYDAWLVKIDSLGNKVWDKTLGGDDDEDLFRVIQSPDGGYFVASDSKSSISGDKTSTAIQEEENEDQWLVRLDQSGNFMWDIARLNGFTFYNIELPEDGGILLNETNLGQLGEGGEPEDYIGWSEKLSDSDQDGYLDIFDNQDVDTDDDGQLNVVDRDNDNDGVSDLKEIALTKTNPVVPNL